MFRLLNLVGFGVIMIYSLKEEKISNCAQKPTYKYRGAKGKTFLGLAIIASLFINTIALAGGLYINEFGTPSMGVAGAGANAVE